MNRALLAVEAVKLRRSPVTWTASVVLVLVVPALCALFLRVSGVVGGAPGTSPAARKVQALLIAEGWPAYLNLLAQVLSVATLLAVGFVVTWSVGRELADGTAAAVLVLPVDRRQVLLAKLAVVLAWALLICAAAVGVGCVLGLFALGGMGADALPAIGIALAVGALGAVLALPLALVAVLGRGYLPAIGALLALVVVTQVLTTFGAGAWFPYAAPSLCAGMGGAAAAEAVTPLQLLLVLPVGAAGAAAAAGAWARLELA